MPFDIKQVIRVIDGRQFKGLRAAILIAVAVQVLLWLGLFVYIDRTANPKGDGLEWIAVVMATYILVIFVAPALILGAINRLLTIGTLFAAAGAVVNLIFYLELAHEFAAIAAR